MYPYSNSNGDAILCAVILHLCDAPSILKWHFSVSDHNLKLADPSHFSCARFSAINHFSLSNCSVLIRKMIAFRVITSSLLFTHEYGSRQSVPQLIMAVWKAGDVPGLPSYLQNDAKNIISLVESRVATPKTDILSKSIKVTQNWTSQITNVISHLLARWCHKHFRT